MLQINRADAKESHIENIFFYHDPPPSPGEGPAWPAGVPSGRGDPSQDGGGLRGGGGGRRQRLLPGQGRAAGGVGEGKGEAPMRKKSDLPIYAAKTTKKNQNYCFSRPCVDPSWVSKTHVVVRRTLQ